MHDAATPPVTHFRRQHFSQYEQAGRPAHYRHNGKSREEWLAKGLAWFSIGLGLAQLLAPRTMSRAAGVNDHPLLMRAIGVREIAAGVGILSQRQSTPWLWTRVAGDAMDLTMLGIAVADPGKRRKRLAAATAAVAGVAALDVLSSVRQTRQESATGSSATDAAIDVEKSISVNRSLDDCYLFWHDFQNFPRFMKHLDSVQLTGENRSHWKAAGPAETSRRWDAEVTVDQPSQLLAWHSVPDAEIEHAGTVAFERAPGGRGTIVRVQLRYRPPVGASGDGLIDKLFGDAPERQIDEDLRRFKALLETGEIPTTEGQPSGRRNPIARLLFWKGVPE